MRLAHLASLTTALCACASHAPPSQAVAPPVVVVVAAKNPCDEAAKLRDSVSTLLDQGRLDRSLRVIDEADALCPSTAAKSWSARLDTLTDLGRFDEAAVLAHRVESDSTANAADRDAANRALHASRPPSSPDEARASIRAGMEFRSKGALADAQRAFDRGIAALEQTTHSHLSIESRFPSDPTRTTIQWSPNGALVALAQPGQVALFDAHSWEELGRFTAPTTGMNPIRIVFTPDAHGLIVDEVGTAPDVIDLARMRVTAHLEHPGVLSPDRSLLVSGLWDNTLRLSEIPSGKAIGELAVGSKIAQIAVSQAECTTTSQCTDKHVLFVTEDYVAHLYDVSTARVVTTFATTDLTGIAASPDGRFFAIGRFDRKKTAPSGNYQGLIELRETAKGKLVRTLSVPDPPRYVSYAEELYSVYPELSPDGRVVLSTNGQGYYTAFDTASGRSIKLSRGQQTNLGIAKNGFILAEIPQDQSAAILTRVSDAGVTSSTTDAGLSECTLTSNGTEVICFERRSDNHNDVVTVDVATGRTTKRTTLSYDFDKLVPSTDGRTVAELGSWGLRFVDLGTGAVLASLAEAGLMVEQLAFMADDALLATSPYDNGVRRLGGDSPHGMHSEFLPDNPRSNLRLTQQLNDGRVVLVVTRDEDLVVRDAVSAKVLMHMEKMPPGARVAFALSGDGGTLAIATSDIGPRSDERVILYDVQSGNRLSDIATEPHPFISFSPDGATLAITRRLNGGNGSTEFWSLATHKRNALVPAPTGFALFSPDSTEWLSLTPEGLRLFRVSDGSTITTLHQIRDIYSAAFDAKGRTLATTGQEGAAWNLDTGNRLATFSLAPSQSPTVVAMARDGATVALASREGQISIRRVSDGAVLATVLALVHHDVAIVMGESGFDVIGDETALGLELSGHVGPFAVPWQACEDRLRRPQLLKRALSHREPIAISR